MGKVALGVRIMLYQALNCIGYCVIYISIARFSRGSTALCGYATVYRLFVCMFVCPYNVQGQ